ncbi:sugar transferase [Prochlorococcus marinus]|uniref:Sugar transferase n=1 Tax=Prochlorococcus marinus XMU1408 TaxID=2213228 RepID=A0A318R5A0_PROMR|nr:sugar transferase [Prochlorococcus marinus]MBW3041840.1 sugar transferase [Prochlorococcus marinus str. XMU1408]PYE02978.1 sugar transferase [Prochlorococcus marinus XMU1408]
MKRLIDIILSLTGLFLLHPFIFICLFCVWIHDFKSPLYISKRIGIGGRVFNMIKIRTMIINAEHTKVDSTVINDSRITPIGFFIRKYKIDEIMQLINILKGDMSLVGPRPNVKRETDLYTSMEKKLLSIKPGLTDFASIVFSDEGNIISNTYDPNIAYNQLVRPGKSILGLFYVDKKNIFVDILLILITLISFLSRRLSLDLVVLLLKRLGSSKDLQVIASRKTKLVPSPPPGSDEIVTNRSI